MGPVSKVLLLLAVVVPVTAYVAGSLASPGSPPPADHSPVILQDADPGGDDDTDEPGPRKAREQDGDGGDDGDDGDDGKDSGERHDGDKARVVTPTPAPVGEDDDGEGDDGDDDEDEDEDEDDDETEAEPAED